MGAQLVREVATKTNDVAGDGTTTATLLAQSIIHEGLKNVSAGANPMVMRKGMEKAVEVAVDTIKANSEAIKGSEDIARVGAVSSSDEAVGKLIAEAMEKVGSSGVITIEESKTAETGLEVVEGMTPARKNRPRASTSAAWKPTKRAGPPAANPTSALWRRHICPARNRTATSSRSWNPASRRKSA